MKIYPWQQYDHRPVILLGSVARAVPLLSALKKKEAEVFLIDPNPESTVSRKIRNTESRQLENVVFISPGSELPENGIPVYCGVDTVRETSGSVALLCRAAKTAFDELYMPVGLIPADMFAKQYIEQMERAYYCMHPGLPMIAAELVLTEKCTLRCRDCANLMQYYEHPVDADPERMLHSLSALLRVTTGIGELRLLGGEPLLCPENLNRTLELLAREGCGKLLAVRIVTNGTLPAAEKTLELVLKAREQSGAFFWFDLSNYGPLSVKEELLKETLMQRGIFFTEHDPDETWLDYGPVERCDLTDEEADLVVRGCSFRRYCNTLLDGKLYYCPRIAHGIRLGLIPDLPGAGVDVAGQTNDMLLRLSLTGFFLGRPPAELCRYCGEFRRQSIPKAIQADRREK